MRTAISLFYLLSLNFTLLRPKVESLANKALNVPVLGVVGALLKDWMPLLDEYYYCERSLSPLSIHSPLTHVSRFCPLIPPPMFLRSAGPPCGPILYHFGSIVYEILFFWIYLFAHIRARIRRAYPIRLPPTPTLEPRLRSCAAALGKLRVGAIEPAARALLPMVS